jgi:uncharacterized protein (DUF427 family)
MCKQQEKRKDKKMKKAVWNGKVIAESDQTRVIKVNHYFPPESVRQEYLKKTDYHTTCPWKGKASYYNVVVDGKVNRNAAWYYPEPNKAASEVTGYIAFWNGVTVG